MRLDSEVDTDLKLSINFSFYVIILPLSSSLLDKVILKVGTEKVINFSVVSPKHSSLPLNSFPKCLIMNK